MSAEVSRNLSGQNYHATIRDKKNVQPLMTKKNHAIRLKFLARHVEFVTVYLGLVMFCYTNLWILLGQE